MNDYPSTSPWGPHGPQVDAHTTTPNPTAPYQDPTFQSQPSQSWDTGAAAPSASSGGGGYAAPLGATGAAVAGPSFGVWMRNLAIAGGVLGCLAGMLRSVALHQSLAVLGVVSLRLGVAGAAVGASIPPAFRVAGSLVRAALWLVIAVFLWGIAAAALGRLDWLTRLR